MDTNHFIVCEVDGSSIILGLLLLPLYVEEFSHNITSHLCTYLDQEICENGAQVETN